MIRFRFDSVFKTCGKASDYSGGNHASSAGENKVSYKMIQPKNWQIPPKTRSILKWLYITHSNQHKCQWGFTNKFCTGKLICAEFKPLSFDTNISVFCSATVIDKNSLAMYRGVRIGCVFGGLSQMYFCISLVVWKFLQHFIHWKYLRSGIELWF